MEYYEPLYVSAGVSNLDTLSVKVLPKMFEKDDSSSFTQIYDEEETNEA